MGLPCSLITLDTSRMCSFVDNNVNMNSNGNQNGTNMHCYYLFNDTELRVIKDNTVNGLTLGSDCVAIKKISLSFHLKMQIPMKSFQVTVCEWALPSYL